MNYTIASTNCSFYFQIQVRDLRQPELLGSSGLRQAFPRVEARSRDALSGRAEHQTLS